jgi:hypothetical protein
MVTITKEETERHCEAIEDHYEGAPSARACGLAARHMRALQTRIDELEAQNAMTTAVATALSERLAKIDAALDWASIHAELSGNFWRVTAHEGKGDCEYFDNEKTKCVDALIVLHGRAGK